MTHLFEADLPHDYPLCTITDDGQQYVLTEQRTGPETLIGIGFRIDDVTQTIMLPSEVARQFAAVILNQTPKAP